MAFASLIVSAGMVTLLIRASLRVRPAQQKWVAFWAQFPAGLSTFVVGLGYWLSFERWLDPFSDHLGWVVFLQAVLGVPFLYRSIWPWVLSSQSSLVEAARVLGASRMRTFWAVDWPRLRAPLASAFGVFFLSCLGDLAALSLFSAGNFEEGVPLPIVISRALGRYQFDEAQTVMGALLLAGFLFAIVLRQTFQALGFIAPRAQDFFQKRNRT
jgi:thiamine transport system permease protein